MVGDVRVPSQYFVDFHMGNLVMAAEAAAAAVLTAAMVLGGMPVGISMGSISQALLCCRRL